MRSRAKRCSEVTANAVPKLLKRPTLRFEIPLRKEGEQRVVVYRLKAGTKLIRVDTAPETYRLSIYPLALSPSYS